LDWPPENINPFLPEKWGKQSNNRKEHNSLFSFGPKQASLLISSPSPCLRNVMIRTTRFTLSKEENFFLEG
jgi:hypothetical protein